MGESHFCPGNSKYFLTFHKMLGFAVTVFDDQLQQELFVLHCATSVLDKMTSCTAHYLTAMHNIRDITYKRCRTVCCSRSCVRFSTVRVAEPVAPLLFHARPRWPLQSPGAQSDRDRLWWEIMNIINKRRIDQHAMVGDKDSRPVRVAIRKEAHNDDCLVE